LPTIAASATILISPENFAAGSVILRGPTGDRISPGRHRTEGGRVLYAIGRIEAASTWHPAHGSPLQENWREFVLRELIRNAEDIDADAIIRFDYQNDGVIRIDETGMKLKRVVATGIAVKLSCAA
jgi:hypothetical protein